MGVLFTSLSGRCEVKNPDLSWGTREFFTSAMVPRLAGRQSV
jgi:hypothetical protein